MAKNRLPSASIGWPVLRLAPEGGRGKRTTKARPKTINEAKGTFSLSRTGTI